MFGKGTNETTAADGTRPTLTAELNAIVRSLRLLQAQVPDVSASSDTRSSTNSPVTHHVAHQRSGPSATGPADDPDLAARTNAELCAAMVAIEDVRRSVDALSVEVLSQLEYSRATDKVHGMRTGPWLARESKLPVGTARSQVTVATKVKYLLPLVHSALGSGEIGYQHAKVLADVAAPRILDDLTQMIPHLISLVPLMTFNAWKREVTIIVELLDDDGGHRPGDDITDNKLTLSPSWHGALSLSGQLAGDGATVVSTALTERANQIFHRMKADAELSTDLKVPPRRTLLALALVELIREALGKPIGSTTPPQTEAALIIHAEDPSHASDSQGTPIGKTAHSALLCDPVFTPIIMSFDGTVLDLGRNQRLASKSQRTALRHRDGGCVWPGCENPVEWCDAHHVRHWEHGGPTDIGNQALLCRYHHGVTHRNGWSMHTTDDQWFWWESPSGDTFWSQRHGKRRTGPTPTTKTASGTAPPKGATKPPGTAPPACAAHPACAARRPHSPQPPCSGASEEFDVAQRE